MSVFCFSVFRVYIQTKKKYYAHKYILNKCKSEVFFLDEYRNIAHSRKVEGMAITCSTANMSKSSWMDVVTCDLYAYGLVPGAEVIVIQIVPKV